MSDPLHPREAHDCAGDAAAYVLGALGPAEVEAFRRHLETCVVCRDEVAAFERVVDVLPAAAPQYRAPRGLRRRVVRAVRAAPHPAPTLAPPARRPWLGLGLGRGPRLAGAGALTARLAGAGALTAAAIVVLVLALSGGGSSPRVIAASVTGPGTAQVRLSGGQAELILHGFPAPPAGKVYEVWLERGAGPPRPTRVLFNVTRQGAADVGVTGGLAGVDRLLVTPEPDGGSQVPTHAPIIVAQLS